MPKCIDCDSYEDEKRNYCKELKSGLTFPPTVEVVCPKFKVRKPEK